MSDSHSLKSIQADGQFGASFVGDNGSLSLWVQFEGTQHLIFMLKCYNLTFSVLWNERKVMFGQFICQKIWSSFSTVDCVPVSSALYFKRKKGLMMNSCQVGPLAWANSPSAVRGKKAKFENSGAKLHTHTHTRTHARTHGRAGAQWKGNILIWFWFVWDSLCCHDFRKEGWADFVSNSATCPMFQNWIGNECCHSCSRIPVLGVSFVVN